MLHITFLWKFLFLCGVYIWCFYLSIFSCKSIRKYNLYFKNAIFFVALFLTFMLFLAFFFHSTKSKANTSKTSTVPKYVLLLEHNRCRHTCIKPFKKGATKPQKPTECLLHIHKAGWVSAPIIIEDWNAYRQIPEIHKSNRELPK